MQTTIHTIKIPEGWHAEVNEKEGVIEIVKNEEKPQRARSWEEYCSKTDSVGMWFIEKGEVGQMNIPHLAINPRDHNIYRTEKLARAVLAKTRLLLLRDDWVGDWNPAYDSYSQNYAIESVYGGSIVIEACHHSWRWLSFPTREMADEFHSTFRTMIEEAKILL